MPRNLVFFLSTLFTTQALSLVCIADERPSVWDYLHQRATRLAEQLPPLPTTLDGWQEQRVRTIRGLNDALGLPKRASMKAAVTDSQQDGDLILEDVVYHWAENTYVSATVIRDATATGPLPALVVSPGWKGHYTFQAYRTFVDDLARHGILVLFIDDPRTGRRHAPAAGLYAAAATAGTPMAGVQVFDVLRGIDYLQTRPDVDSTWIGIGGLGEGAIHSYLAAALEPQLKFVIAIGGTTTYRSLVRATGPGQGPEDPSVFIFNILDITDLDRLACCIAPRPIIVAGSGHVSSWPDKGQAEVLAAMAAIYKLYGAGENIRYVPGEIADDFAPYTAQIIEWLTGQVLAKPEIVATARKPVSEPEQPDFSILRYMQRRIEKQSDARADRQSHADRLADASAEDVQWVASTCAIPSLKPADDQLLALTETDGLTTEQLALGVDTGYRCPAVLVRSNASSGSRFPAVVLSHDDRQSVAAPRITDAIQRLASLGYLAIAPDHASAHPQSTQPLGADDKPSFYGDEAARFYGPASAVGVTPLSLRVAEIRSAVNHLCNRDEVDPQRIIVAGVGIGSISGCLAAAIDDRIAGIALVGATTAHNWCVESAPNEHFFFHLAPVLPGMARHADLDLFAAAIAPRPLLLVRRKLGWPRAGIDRILETARPAYGLRQADDALVCLGPREVPERLESAKPDSIQKQLLDAASSLMPAPPTPGVVGNLDGLKPRHATDSAVGLIWIVSEMDGYEQELVGNGFRLMTWSLFNDNGAAQEGRVATPLILKQEGDTFTLTGIGKPRSNDGSGLQAFDFEPVQGTDRVGDGYFFGWYTGDLQGRRNPGVIEFEDAPDSLMTILTVSGDTANQKLSIGNTYRRQSQYRRRYSVMAVASPKAWAAEPQQQQFRFVQLCDTQLGFGADGYESDVESFRQAVRQINQIKPDFAVICGDLVNSPTADAFADFRKVLSEFKVPCYCAPGNHDVGGPLDQEKLDQYRQAIGKDYYSFEHNGYTFVVVNTQLWKSPVEPEAPKHDSWFAQTLRHAAEISSPVFVVGHHPLFLRDADEEEEYFNIPTKRRKEVLSLFLQHGVVAMLTGHTHRLCDNEYQGILLLSGETTSKNFDSRPFGFRLWEVDAAGSIRHRFKPLELRDTAVD